MKSTKQPYIGAILILSIMIYTYFQNNGSKDVKNKGMSATELSFKELKRTGKITNDEEYFDTQRNIYSNYRYSIAVDLPDNWNSDYGVSAHTIWRSYNFDSAITFSINVIKQEMGDDFDLWNFFDSNQSEYTKMLIDETNSQLNVIQKATNIKKVHIKNIKALRIYDERDHIQEDITWVNSNIQYQAFRNDYLYTFTLTMPKEFYNNNPKYYDSYFQGLSFLRIE